MTPARNRSTPGYLDNALDVGGIFIDSLIYAESFRVVRRPGSRLLEVAEGGMAALDKAGRPARPVAWHVRL